jgi:hypothetical protein
VVFKGLKSLFIGNPMVEQDWGSEQYVLEQFGRFYSTGAQNVEASGGRPCSVISVL